jgi:hypothetical protein
VKNALGSWPITTPLAVSHVDVEVRKVEGGEFHVANANLKCGGGGPEHFAGRAGFGLGRKNIYHFEPIKSCP